MDSKTSPYKGEAQKLIARMSHDDLKCKIIIPMFQHQTWLCEDVDRHYEVETFCDILLTAPHDPLDMQGIQVKAREDISTRSDVARDLMPAAVAALDYTFLRKGRETRLARFYWITSGKVSHAGSIAIRERLNNNRNPSTNARVEVWDSGVIVDKLLEWNCQYLLELLELGALVEQGDYHEKSEEPMFSAHYQRRILLWHLSHQSGSREAARDAADHAARLLLPVVPTNRKRSRVNSTRLAPYFYRCLRESLAEWRTLVVNKPELLANWRGQHEMLIRALGQDEVRTLLAREHGQPKAALLLDYEHCWIQMKSLSDRHHVERPSLATLQLLRLLLRSGMTPHERTIERRLERLVLALDKEEGLSIDQRCSLCTGTATSCLMLANRRKRAAPAARWLGSLEKERFSYLEGGAYYHAGPAEHALHYAATVLIALLDSRFPHKACRRAFFADSGIDQHGFYSEWLRYRNVDRHEVCRYIFDAFLRYLLAGFQLTRQESAFLIRALKGLAHFLINDAESDTRIWTTYAARLNITSFVLGVVLGQEEFVEPAREAVRILRKRAQRAVRDDPEETETWDSSFDRTRVLVDGLLQTWEVFLFLSDSDHPNARLMEAVLA